MELFRFLSQLRVRLMFRGQKLTTKKENAYQSLIQMWEMGRDPYDKYEKKIR